MGNYEKKAVSSTSKRIHHSKYPWHCFHRFSSVCWGQKRCGIPGRNIKNLLNFQWTRDTKILFLFYDFLSFFKLINCRKPTILKKLFLKFQNASKLGALLQILRTQPEQLAQWLIIGEQLNDEQTHLSIMQSIVSGLYASLIFPEDINYMLVLLHELAKNQLFRNEKPQRYTT